LGEAAAKELADLVGMAIERLGRLLERFTRRGRSSRRAKSSRDFR
jgi:hypothetical protein